jgi:hypothetical protein
MKQENRCAGVWPGLALVTLGGGLLAREFGYLPASVRLVDFWPLLVMMIGIGTFTNRRGFWGALFSLAFIAMGGVLLAGNLGFLAFPAARLWPGLLVLAGLAFLIRGRRGSDFRGPPPPRTPVGSGASSAGEVNRGPFRRFDPHQHSSSNGEDRLNKQYTFAGAQLRIESQAWKGGELGVTAGGVELDLRNARLDPEGAVLDVRIVMGGVEIRVPDTWQIQCEVTPLFGGADDETRPPQGSTNAPRLRIVGTATLGGINVRN